MDGRARAGGRIEGGETLVSMSDGRVRRAKERTQVDWMQAAVAWVKAVFEQRHAMSVRPHEVEPADCW